MTTGAELEKLHNSSALRDFLDSKHRAKKWKTIKKRALVVTLVLLAVLTYFCATSTSGALVVRSCLKPHSWMKCIMAVTTNLM